MKDVKGNERSLCVAERHEKEKSDEKLKKYWNRKNLKVDNVRGAHEKDSHTRLSPTFKKRSDSGLEIRVSSSVQRK